MPLGIPIGPLFIHFYGVIIMLGALAGAWLASREAQRRGESSDRAWDALTWAIIGGVIGARLWHVLTPTVYNVEGQDLTTNYYFTHPMEAIAVWKGGLGIPGAVIGGATALFLFARHYKLSFLTWTDIVAPGLALGQAIGRWGNFVNQELYGKPCNFPWCITIDPVYRLPQYQDIARYHPIFLYESIWNFLNVIFLLWIGRRFSKSLKAGDIFLIYLITYPFARFFLEFLRLDPSMVGGLNINQSIMILSIVCSSALLIIRHHSSYQKNDTVIESEISNPSSSQGTEGE